MPENEWADTFNDLMEMGLPNAAAGCFVDAANYVQRFSLLNPAEIAARESAAYFSGIEFFEGALTAMWVCVNRRADQQNAAEWIEAAEATIVEIENAICQLCSEEGFQDDWQAVFCRVIGLDRLRELLQDEL